MTISGKEIINKNLKKYLVADYPLNPNIIRLATKRLAGGKQSRALNPIPRIPCNKILSLEKASLKSALPKLNCQIFKILLI